MSATPRGGRSRKSSPASGSDHPAGALRPGRRPGDMAKPTSLWDRFKRGLEKTRHTITGIVGQALCLRTLDAATVETLEEALLAADVGPVTTDRLIADARRRLQQDGSLDLRGALERAAADVLGGKRVDFVPGPEKPWVALLVGVNGVGKTTFAGKLAAHFAREGRRTMLVAADTFRAAAGQQLDAWAGPPGGGARGAAPR